MNIGLNDKYIKNLNEIFASFHEVEEVILYGSRAIGNFRQGSDIDLTMKGKRLNLQILNKISVMIDDLLIPYIVDLSIYDTIENTELKAHINRIGKTFYKKKVVKS